MVQRDSRRSVADACVRNNATCSSVGFVGCKQWNGYIAEIITSSVHFTCSDKIQLTGRQINSYISTYPAAQIGKELDEELRLTKIWYDG